MAEPNPLFFALQRLVSDLSLINRNHYVLNSDKQENDIEHSFSVALLCWFIIEHYQIDLDLAKILKYAMVHDFAERYAGDVNTFASQAAREKKVELERAAVKKLNSEFKDFKGLVKALNDYDAKADDEALFVWTVDKMQAMILGDLDKWRPYQEISITYETFEKKYQEQLTMCSRYCKDIFEALLAYCKTTYYDRPV